MEEAARVTTLSPLRIIGTPMLYLENVYVRYQVAQMEATWPIGSGKTMKKKTVGSVMRGNPVSSRGRYCPKSVK